MLAVLRESTSLLNSVKLNLMTVSKKLPFFFLLCLTTATILIASCQKNDVVNINESGLPYPVGIAKVGKTGETNCELDRCDPDRKIILKAEQVEGSVGGGIDSITQVERYYVRSHFPGKLDG